MLKATVRATCVLLLPFETHTSNSVINSNNEYKQRIEKKFIFLVCKQSIESCTSFYSLPGKFVCI